MLASVTAICAGFGTIPLAGSTGTETPIPRPEEVVGAGATLSLAAEGSIMEVLRKAMVGMAEAVFP